LLTDKTLKSLKPRETPYKRGDGKGLYVIVRPDGALWWRFKYRFQGREKLLSLGVYPDTSLKVAREKRDAARAQIAGGTDPSVTRQTEKAAYADTFEAVAREWLAKLRIKSSTVEQLRHRLETYAFPYLGRYPIRTISASDLLAVLRRIEGRGRHETAHRVRSLAGRVFRYAVATGRAEHDVSSALKGALAPVKSASFAAITDPRRIGELLRAIDSYQGQPAVMAALKLAPIVFVRPTELRAAEWLEFDMDAAEWRIPAVRMKMGEPHVVPLAMQAVVILEELYEHTGSGRLLFPSLRSSERPISDNTLNAALRRLGYSGDEQTTHGFRSIASTRLNELGFPPDVIELQLAHKERSAVRAAYNRAERLGERRAMMQTWADYLDGLKVAKPGDVPQSTYGVTKFARASGLSDRAPTNGSRSN
jgi:integrase